MNLLEAHAGVWMDSSEELIAGVRQGDENAFRLIFEQHHRFVFRFLYGMVGDRRLAEELMQETFMQAYKNIGTLREEAKLLSWLCGIARHVALHSLRSRPGKNQWIGIDDQEIAELKEAQGTPETKMLNAELKAVIHDALAALDDDKRGVFILKVLQQMSYEEIAEVTGFSIPKLKTDLHRAKAQMRRLIRPYLEVRDEM
ncbi:MAG TPA: RNA polymerase sigma factor [Pyrinomonadaceae bacterium]|nr:RNA polymerase sigma factor [Pyrinomonadaceae bacterium]